MYPSTVKLASTQRQSAFGVESKASKLFLLSNQSQARKSIKATNFGLHYDDFFSKAKQDARDKETRRQHMLGGDFQHTYLNHHTRGIARTNEDSFL
jgi:Leu/Phe-tRNA-protein transferase